MSPRGLFRYDIRSSLHACIWLLLADVSYTTFNVLLMTCRAMNEFRDSLCDEIVKLRGSARCYCIVKLREQLTMPSALPRPM